jgi:hypothetical protein
MFFCLGYLTNRPASTSGVCWPAYVWPTRNVSFELCPPGLRLPVMYCGMWRAGCALFALRLPARVSLFRSFINFRFDAHLVSLFFVCFCVTKKYPLHSAYFRLDFFRYFASIFLLQTKKTLRYDFLASTHFFRYFAPTFSLQNTFIAISRSLFCFES